MNGIDRWSNAALVLLALTAVLCLGSGRVAAQPASPLDGFGLSGLGEEKSGEPKVTMRFVPEQAAVGEIVAAEITIQLGKDSYVYSQNPNVGAETKIDIRETIGLDPVDAKFIPSKKPKTVIEPLFDNARLEKFYGGVTWRRAYRVTGNGAPKLEGTLKYQVCDANSCNPFEKPIAIVGQLGKPKAKSKQPTLKMILGDKSKQTPTTSPASKPDSTTMPPLQGVLLARTKIPADGLPGQDEKVHFDVQLLETGRNDTSEKIVAVVITATLESGWHIYAQTQDPAMSGLPTIIKVESSPGLIPIDPAFLPTKAPEVTHPLKDITHIIFHHTATWQRRFRVNADEFTGNISGSIRYQLCDAGSCLPPKTVEFTLGNENATSRNMNATGNSSPLSPANTPVDNVENDENGIDGETASSERSSPVPVEESSDITSDGLVPFLITGVIFGYLALLTPCVFPMIPITVSFFLKQAEKEHHNAIGMATLYCLGIIGTFTIIGLAVSIFFGGSGMTEAANLPWLNIFIAAVLVFFGMNMLGMFEIQVPSWMLSWSSSKEQQGGFLGVLFMSLTFTLVSFTCTFAFVGTLLPMAAQGDYYWPILGMLAFSTAFASPFFFLALFPSFLKKMPQSGGWMNRVKVTMGLIEIGAAFKFLSVADIGWFSVPYLFDYALVMTSWMVICIVAGIYLLGFFRLPHDTAADSIGVLQLSFAMTFLGFAAYLATGIFGAHPPEGAVWQQIAAFAPPTFETGEDADLGPTLEHDGLLYALDVEQAINYAGAKKQPLFYDFTGVNCVNCRFMEINVLSQKENRDLLEKFVRVQLYIDTIPAMSDKEQIEKLLAKNRTLQAEWFKSVSMPAYAIVSPDGKKILSSYKGKERNSGEFTRFLKAGLAEWQREKVAMNSGAFSR